MLHRVRCEERYCSNDFSEILRNFLLKECWYNLISTSYDIWLRGYPKFQLYRVHFQELYIDQNPLKDATRHHSSWIPLEILNTMQGVFHCLTTVLKCNGRHTKNLYCLYRDIFLINCFMPLQNYFLKWNATCLSKMELLYLWKQEAKECKWHNCKYWAN